MSSFTVFFSLLVICKVLAQQSVVLDANTPILSNISVGVNAEEVTVNNSDWNADITTQFGSTFNISMGSSFGFHATKKSTISLTINGYVPNATLSGDYADIIGLVSVDNNKFFSFVFRLDDERHAYKVYPESGFPLATTSNVHNLIYSNDALDSRFHRWSQNTNPPPDTFKSVNPLYKEQAVLPVTISIENNPVDGQVIYQYTDSNDPAPILSAMFNTSFTTNNGIKIYLSGDSENERFTITSFQIDYDIETESPTLTPTTNPTTNTPTTRSPTTTQPTSMPTTYAPTIIPTTLSPLTVPPITNNPTTSVPSTSVPSVSPTTIQPSMSPTTSLSSTTSQPITNIPTTNSPITSTLIKSTTSGLSTTNVISSSTLSTLHSTKAPTIQATIRPTSAPSLLTSTAFDTDDTSNTNADQVNDTSSYNLSTIFPFVIAGSILLCVSIVCIIGCIIWNVLKGNKFKDSSNSNKKRNYGGIMEQHRNSVDKIQKNISIDDGNNTLPSNNPMIGIGNSSSSSSTSSTLSTPIKDNKPIIKKQSTDLSHNLSNGVTGDGIIMDDIHHHINTADHDLDEDDDDDDLDDLDMDIITKRGRGVTFNNNLRSIATGNDIMLNDAVNNLITSGGDNNDLYKNYLSEAQIKHLNQMNTKGNSDILIDVNSIEGNNINSDGDNDDNDVNVVNDDDLLFGDMETSGFIDDQYNRSYDNEYYEEDK